ncbi:MAG: phosphate ABC transporter permease subunit PstC [Rickettsiales bacterium]|nr:phosphate ABC transporter permease subunit PstC [Rickettsiales bacterium]
MILSFFALFFALYLAKILEKKLTYQQVKSKIKRQINFKSRSLPIHYSYCFSIWALLLLISLYLSGINGYLIISISLTASFTIFFAIYRFRDQFNAKSHLDWLFRKSLLLSATIGILITLAIMMAIFGEAGKFFKLIAWQEFFFGTKWNPQLAMNSGQEVAKSSFGAVPVFLGTILITLVAMFIAVPIGIMGAVNLTLYCKSSTRDLLKPILEILAGIPTVVYGYFAVIFIAPIFKLFFGFLNIEIASESALSAGFVMGIMIIPFILSLTDDAINSVPKSLYDGALAMGSTNYEMISKVIIPSAMPAIIGSIILAVSRAIGETMIVVMSAGLLAKMTFNPLDSATTATAQIVSLLSGDQEFSSSKTLASFALALTLFVVTFIFNILALIVIKKYQKKNG